ncbi:MAG: hypothetical protein ACXWV9_00540 [Flavisolibacter sp.]
MRSDLMDDYWLFINPVLLGIGIPLFNGINEIQKIGFEIIQTIFIWLYACITKERTESLRS